MILLDGKKLAQEQKEVLTAEIAKRVSIPHLAIIQIGNDAASDVYVARKATFGKAIGAEVTVLKLPEETTNEEAVLKINALNNDRSVHGIIIQLPVPAHINKELVVNTIDQTKDVDGLTAINMWKLMDDKTGIVTATARGTVALLKAHSIDLEGAHVTNHLRDGQHPEAARVTHEVATSETTERFNCVVE